MSLRDFGGRAPRSFQYVSACSMHLTANLQTAPERLLLPQQVKQSSRAYCFSICGRSSRQRFLDGPAGRRSRARTSSRLGAFSASKSFGSGPDTEDSPSGSMGRV